MAITRRQKYDRLLANSHGLRSRALRHAPTVSQLVAHQPGQVRRKCAPRPPLLAHPNQTEGGGLKPAEQPAAERSRGHDREPILTADQIGGQNSVDHDSGSSLLEGETTTHGNGLRQSDTESG